MPEQQKQKLLDLYFTLEDYMQEYRKSLLWLAYGDHRAVPTRPNKYRDVLKKHFGLYDSQPESLYALSRRKKANVKGTAFYNTKDRALRRLRKLLMQQQGKIISYAVNT